ncbi:MAG: sulfate ABC transporter permease subunit [Actinobacteria bacterium]|nr:sulfate ABC transporter permease subunit [Actinomycetota bacterium]
MSVATGAILAGSRRRRLIRSGLLTLTILYVAVLLLAPLLGIIWIAFRQGFAAMGATFSDPQVQHAAFLTLTITAVTVTVTAIFGVVVAWLLARDNFRGRSLLDALVDLPFAVSPITVGVMAFLLFSPGGLFEPLFTSLGIQVLFAVPAMVLVTIFISIPFVVRGVVPVLRELGQDEEEAARTLGASSLQSFFRVTLPNIKWGLLYGVALSTARALGEIGAVLIVSGQIQGQNETLTLFILRAIEERQEPQAYLVALSLAAVSILILTLIEFFKHRQAKETAR